MTRKLLNIPISDVLIPSTILTETAKNELSFISESLNEKSELFFVTVIPYDKKYTLVDRYDVYLAAIQSKIKEIPALIISSKHDSMQSHFQITMKSVLNPVKIINSMKPYVKKFGLDDTVKKLHLHSDFAQMYQLGLDQETLDSLNDMITALCNMGARTSVPLTLFIFTSKVEKKLQSMFVKSLYNMVKKSDRHFRWPHNTYLRKLEMGDDDITSKKTPEKKLQIPEIDFCCQTCDTQYIVSDGTVHKVDESQKGIEIRHKNDSTPRILIPSEIVEYLGVTAKKPPKIISSSDVNEQEVLSYLKGKKFVIILGENQG